MRRVALLLAAGALAAITACAPAPPAHDKAWYAAHADARAQALAACRADPGRRQATAVCVNAKAAEADDTNLFARTGLPVAKRGIGGDTRAEQRRDGGKVEIGGNGVGEALVNDIVV